MSVWIDQIFEAAAANGNVVRRSKADVEKYASFDTLLEEVKTRQYHLIETGDQCVVLCHTGALTIHC